MGLNGLDRKEVPVSTSVWIEGRCGVCMCLLRFTQVIAVSPTVQKTCFKDQLETLNPA